MLCVFLLEFIKTIPLSLLFLIVVAEVESVLLIGIIILKNF